MKPQFQPLKSHEQDYARAGMLQKRLGMMVMIVLMVAGTLVWWIGGR